MPYVIEHVKVENIQIELEQENAATWLKVLPYDGCGEYNEDAPCGTSTGATPAMMTSTLGSTGDGTRSAR